jgi:hypothetical protein
MRLAAFNVNELAKSKIGTTFKLVLFAFFFTVLYASSFQTYSYGSWDQSQRESEIRS